MLSSQQHPKKFPGIEGLSLIQSMLPWCSLADQGIKVRIRKDICIRKRPITSLAAPIDDDKIKDNQDGEHGKAIVPANGPGKHLRHGLIIM
ncbi:hypothetical protein BKA82DRAFT_4365809 [Pisolithus tinctorius]|nr:hypothetical protein BKA82DRAFT_4365809 [Pisolithus tinctorius]